MVNSRVTLPTQFCPTLKPKFSTWRKTAFFTMSSTELPRYPVSHMAPTERVKHPSLFLNTHSGWHTQDLDAEDWLGRGYISLRSHSQEWGPGEAASRAVDCGTTNQQHSMPRAVAGWPASAQGSPETMVRHLRKVLKARQGSSKQSQIFKGKEVQGGLERAERPVQYSSGAQPQQLLSISPQAS